LHTQIGDLYVRKNKNILQEPDSFYEKGENDLLRDGLSRSYKERFLFLTQLYKTQQTLQKAKITHRNVADSK
jgi:hypothetical protein